MGPLSSRRFIGAGLVLLGLLSIGLFLATQFAPGFLTGGEKPVDAAPQMTTASADAAIGQFTALANRDPSPPLPSGQTAAQTQSTRETPASDDLTERERQLFAQALERQTKRAVELEERRWAAANSPLGESIHGAVPGRDGQNDQGQDQNGTLAPIYGALPSDNPLPDFDGRTTPDPVSPLQSRVPQARATQTTLAAGTVIAAALMGDIRSELPGLVRAMVTHDVFDSQTLRFVVIPRGAQLLGSYSNQTQVGQQRLFVYWTQVRFPDGRVFDLDRPATLDATGASGLTGRRQTGFLTALVQATLLGLAQNAGQGSAGGASQSSDLAEAARIATGQAVGTVTERYLEDQLKRGTRFTIPAGTVLNLILERDFAFPAGARDHGALDRREPGQRAARPTPAARAGNASSTGTAALVLVAGEAGQTGLPYDRSDYGRWADIDGDCQNTRHEVLESLSTARVLKSADGCVVTRGRWLDPYTGAIELNPRALDVDHLVPLAWAHWHGAARWPRDRKRAFANDPRNLFATKAAVNRAKGARGPLDWLPPNEAFHCAYVTRFERIVRIWELTYAGGEAEDMAQLRRNLCA